MSVSLLCQCDGALGGVVMVHRCEPSSPKPNVQVKVGQSRPDSHLDDAQRTELEAARGKGGKCPKCGSWLTLEAIVETSWRVRVSP